MNMYATILLHPIILEITHTNPPKKEKITIDLDHDELENLVE